MRFPPDVERKLTIDRVENELQADNVGGNLALMVLLPGTHANMCGYFTGDRPHSGSGCRAGYYSWHLARIPYSVVMEIPVLNSTAVPCVVISVSMCGSRRS